VGVPTANDPRGDDEGLTTPDQRILLIPATRSRSLHTLRRSRRPEREQGGDLCGAPILRPRFHILTAEARSRLETRCAHADKGGRADRARRSTPRPGSNLRTAASAWPGSSRAVSIGPPRRRRGRRGSSRAALRRSGLLRTKRGRQGRTNDRRARSRSRFTGRPSRATACRHATTRGPSSSRSAASWARSSEAPRPRRISASPAFAEAWSGVRARWPRPPSARGPAVPGHAVRLEYTIEAREFSRRLRAVQYLGIAPTRTCCPGSSARTAFWRPEGRHRRTLTFERRRARFFEVAILLRHQRSGEPFDVPIRHDLSPRPFPGRFRSAASQAASSQAFTGPGTFHI
jgi:hypothetical protein